MSQISTAESSSTTPDLRALRQSILAHLAQALDAAALRLARAADGECPFENELDAKTTLALLKTLPDLLPRLRNPKPPTDENPDDDDDQEYSTPSIPICPICLQGRGAHWVRDCPQLHPHHDLAVLKALQGNAVNRETLELLKQKGLI